MAMTKVSSMDMRMVACWVVMKAALKAIWSVARWVASMEIQLVVLMAAQLVELMADLMVDALELPWVVQSAEQMVGPLVEQMVGPSDW